MDFAWWSGDVSGDDVVVLVDQAENMIKHKVLGRSYSRLRDHHDREAATDNK